MPLLALLAVAAVLLSGCVGGAAEGRRLEPLPPVKATSAEPARTPGSPPTPAGAAAAARAWFALLTAAGASGDAAALRAAADPGCTACSSLADFVEAGHRDGSVLRGFAYQPSSVTPGPLTGARVVVELVVDVVGGTRTTAAGEQRLRDRSGVPNRMTLERRADRWVVVELVQPR